jgi:GAF domain-containing protein
MKAPLPTNEAERLAALKEYHILDTGTEQSYDDITILAAHICKVPIAMISLVDEVRQWFKSRVGLEQQQTSRDVAFCAHAILQNEPLIVRDATKDRRFADSPLVTGEPHVRFYAGFPLINAEGLALGTLCVIDRQPRQLSAEQLKTMQALSRQVMALLESRRVSARLADALGHVKTLQALLPICAWCKRIRDDEGYWDQIEAYFHKYTGTDFTHGICPQCLEKAHAEWEQKRSATEAEPAGN